MASRYLIAMVTCASNAARARACRETWLADLPDDVDFVEVHGGGEGPVIRNGDRLTVPVPEDYGRLPDKTWQLMCWIAANPDIAYVMKCDDDLYVPDPVGVLREHRGDYVGRFLEPRRRGTWHYAKVEAGRRVPYQGPWPARYATGCCYILSRRAVGIIASTPIGEIPECRLDVGYEDFMVGNLLETADLERGSLQKPADFVHPLDADGIRARHARQVRRRNRSLRRKAR